MLIWNQHPISCIVSQLQSTCISRTLWDLAQFFLGKLVQCKALSIRMQESRCKATARKLVQGIVHLAPSAQLPVAAKGPATLTVHPLDQLLPAGSPVCISATWPWFLWTNSGLPSCSGSFLSPMGGCSLNQLEPLHSGIFLHHQQVACSWSPVRSDSHPGAASGRQGGALFQMCSSFAKVFSLSLAGSSCFLYFLFFMLLSSLFPLLATFSS